MLKFVQKKLKEEKGLTLIELLAVIVILAIIAAIAVPAIGNIIENSRYSAVKSDAVNVLSAANLYFTENPSATSVSIPELTSNGFLESPGKIPAGTDSDKIVKKDGKGGKDTITVTVTAFSGTKNVIFSNATVDDINNDKQKGSEDGNKTIPKPTT
ncbi:MULTISPECIES: prepilin-type N-terminal cleavage/methylation domain-containing protein [Bhargavaea]|uniref:Prepilin-type N-terminal cleavage/methylation domain-containing protein n=1 Tax=Bhargavaea changchunensis TaxID=2134037 RepID=A0ABW2NG50_9BACL|nr:prepilin-type N-terminal cleavage/methylation domain-containing protein [Bhargavaea sp. CC-171006]